MGDDGSWSHLGCSKQPVCSSNDAGIALALPWQSFPNTAAVFPGFPLINYLSFISTSSFFHPESSAHPSEGKRQAGDGASRLSPRGGAMRMRIGLVCVSYSDGKAKGNTQSTETALFFFFWPQKRKYMDWEK